MMLLTLNDGTQFEVDDNSTKDQILLTTSADNMKLAIEKINNKNLNHATLNNIIIDNVSLNNIMIVPFDATSETGTIIFYLNAKTGMDIIQERLDEQDAALMELAELIAG